jgi:hypothetical protein
VIIPPTPAAVRDYFSRRRLPRDLNRGFAPDELQFNEALWRTIGNGELVAPVDQDAAARAPPEDPEEKSPVRAQAARPGAEEPTPDDALIPLARVTTKIAPHALACPGNPGEDPGGASPPVTASASEPAQDSDGELAGNDPPMMSAEDVSTPPGVATKFSAPPRPCATCKRPFQPWRPHDTFCSNACRQKAFRERAGAKRAAKISADALPE